MQLTLAYSDGDSRRRNSYRKEVMWKFEWFGQRERVRGREIELTWNRRKLKIRMKSYSYYVLHGRWIKTERSSLSTLNLKLNSFENPQFYDFSSSTCIDFYCIIIFFTTFFRRFVFWCFVLYVTDWYVGWFFFSHFVGWLNKSSAHLWFVKM